MGILYITYLAIFRKLLYHLFEDFLKKRMKFEYGLDEIFTTTME